MSAPSVVRIRRMSAADLERVLGIAESLPQAPQWPASAYIAAMDTGNTPRRIALVAECVSGEERDSREVPENQTSGAKAQTRLAESDAGTKVPAYHAPFFEIQSSQSPMLPVAGFVVAVLVPPEAELETIAVVESAQRLGVGRQLLQGLADELRTQQAKSLNLEVRASNLAALRVYRSQEFEEIGRRKRYYSDPEEDAVLMRLRLA